MCQYRLVKPGIAKLLRPVTDPVTYRGWMWLVLGGAMLMPYMLVAEVTRLLTNGRTEFASTLITVQFPNYLMTLPIIALTGLVVPVRLLSAIPARALLGVSLAAENRRDWARRWRDAAWFTLHLGGGGLIAGITLAVVPFVLFVLILPFAPNKNALVDQQMGVEWQAWWGFAIGPALMLFLVYLTGATVALCRRLAVGLLGPTAAEQLAATRAEAADLAARNRIARELHDSVGHALSVVTVQSAAAGRVLDANPEFTRTALAAIEDTARRALTELDTVLGVLRGDGPADTEPARGLADLDALIAGSGIRVDLTRPEDLDALSGLLSREAYRIVQESLTNALKHGGEPTATVHIDLDGSRLAIRVANPIALDAASPRAGRGIIGMRERVLVLGGELSAGPRDGDWVVTATLPTGPLDVDSGHG